VEIEPIGTVSSPRADPSYTVGWGDVVATILLEESLGAHSLDGLTDFSHAEIVFWFNQVTRRESYAEVSRARGRDDMPLIGVFGARGPNRPNPIGVSACEILAVAERTLTLRGLDAVDGTPVLDIKPVQARLVPTRVREPEWSARLMSDYF
jgi:tRNA-Thr(GGU) m(6)t(6)A37 methyltransferase TsaA